VSVDNGFDTDTSVDARAGGAVPDGPT